MCDLDAYTYQELWYCNLQKFNSLSITYYVCWEHFVCSIFAVIGDYKNFTTEIFHITIVHFMYGWGIASLQTKIYQACSTEIKACWTGHRCGIWVNVLESGCGEVQHFCSFPFLCTQPSFHIPHLQSSKLQVASYSLRHAVPSLSNMPFDAMFQV